MSASTPDARFSSVWRASSSSPRRMSSMTLAQIVEKPITVATDETISSFADSRHGLRAGSFPAKPVPAACFRRPNGIVRSRPPSMRRKPCRCLKSRQRRRNELTIGCRMGANACKPHVFPAGCPKNRLRQENPCDRLRPAARLSEEAKTSRIRAELRTDRGDHRRCAAARGAPGLVVGNRAQPAGEDAAARSLPRGRLHRDTAGGWQEREVQEDEGEAVARGPGEGGCDKVTR